MWPTVDDVEPVVLMKTELKQPDYLSSIAFFDLFILSIFYLREGRLRLYVWVHF